VSVVSYDVEEPSGLAAMLGGLIEANLANDPSRRSLLRPAVVAVVATDADVGVTLSVSTTGVRVGSGSSPAVTVLGGSASLLALTSTPLRFGLPDPFSEEGRRIIGMIVRRDIVVRGLARHPVVVSRLMRLLSVA
jgi:hypothetical protein